MLKIMFGIGSSEAMDNAWVYTPEASEIHEAPSVILRYEDALTTVFTNCADVGERKESHEDGDGVCVMDAIVMLPALLLYMLMV